MSKLDKDLVDLKQLQDKSNKELTDARLAMTNAIDAESKAREAEAKVKRDMEAHNNSIKLIDQKIEDKTKQIQAKTSELGVKKLEIHEFWDDDLKPKPIIKDAKPPSEAVKKVKAAADLLVAALTTLNAEKVKLEKKTGIEGQNNLLLKDVTRLAGLTAEAEGKVAVAKSEVQKIENAFGAGNTEMKRLESQKFAVEGLSVEAKGPVVLKQTEHMLRPEEDPFDKMVFKWFFGVFVVMYTITANVLMHIPAMMYSNDTADGKGYKKIFWISFAVMYTLGLAFLLFQMIVYGMEAKLNMGLRNFFKNLLIFGIISMLFGILMYYISKTLTSKMRAQEQSVTGIPPTVDQGRPIDIVVICFVAAYVFILQMVSLLLIFGFSMGDAKGKFQGMFKSVLKLNKGYSDNMNMKMEQLSSLITSFGDTYDIAEMMARVEEMKASGYGDFKELLSDLVRISEKSRVPKANAARESEFQEGLLRILFDVSISKKGISTVENKQSDAKLKQIQLKLQAVNTDISKLDAAIGGVCDGTQLNAAKAKLATVTFATSMAMIGQVEQDTLQLLDTLTPADVNFVSTKITLKTANDYRSVLLEKLSQLGNKLSECGTPAAPNCAEVVSPPKDEESPQAFLDRKKQETLK